MTRCWPCWKSSAPSSIFYLPWTFGVQKKVEGFVPYPDGLIRLKGVSVAGK